MISKDSTIYHNIETLIYTPAYWRSAENVTPEIWYQIIDPLEIIGIVDDGEAVLINLKRELENENR